VTEHVVLLVEDLSTEAFLREVLPNILRKELSFEIHSFQSKHGMLKRLPDRLAGYAKWLPDSHKIVVLIDRDTDDCKELKRRLETIATTAGLRTLSAKKHQWQLANRIVVEELEAWILGDASALRAQYPRVNKSFEKKAKYRDVDKIMGGTWEALERILKSAGYFSNGLRKVELARRTGTAADPKRNSSRSFQTFRATLTSLIQKPKASS